jgi:hypothetical protein
VTISLTPPPRRCWSSGCRGAAAAGCWSPVGAASGVKVWASRRCHWACSAAPRASRYCAASDDISEIDADAIADELDNLPLALSLAGSYLETYRNESFGVPANYLANLHRQLLDHRSMHGAGTGPSLTNHG